MEYILLVSSLDSVGGVLQLIIGLAIAGGVIYYIVKNKDKDNPRKKSPESFSIVSDSKPSGDGDGSDQSDK